MFISIHLISKNMPPKLISWERSLCISTCLMYDVDIYSSNMTWARVLFFLNIKMTANVILYSHLINKVLILNYILDVILSIFCSTSPIKLLQNKLRKSISVSTYWINELVTAKQVISIWFYANYVSLCQHIESGQTLSGWYFLKE